MLKDLSVVVVTLNNWSGLRRTLASLQALRGDPEHLDVEVLVVDGGSTDETLQLLDDPHYDWLSVIPGPDNGIYDGMNKGVAASRGEMVWFLNGGDECLISRAGAREALDSDRSKMHLFDFLLHLEGHGDRYIRSRSPRYLWHALPTSHQAMWFPGSLVRQVSYPPDYQISGDYWLACKLSLQTGFIRHGSVIARFYGGGVSTRQAAFIAREAGRIQADVLGLRSPARLLSSQLHRLARYRRRLQMVRPHG